ncbi:hypothetical protein ABZ924_27870 [Streptomyces sp. NPDC046876]|uniref:hypothetical protein n=1 Tax=Streptomyces sp. NPDC046876 TaxID=3155616 RepID=UPI0033C73507
MQSGLCDLFSDTTAPAPLAIRPYGRTDGGAVLLLLAVAALAAIGSLLWWLEKTLPDAQRSRMEQQLEHDKETTAQALLQAAQDGTLTDEEIRAADRGSRWTIRRNSHEVRASAQLAGPNLELQCWPFSFTLPPEAKPAVQAIRDEAACTTPAPPSPGLT